MATPTQTILANARLAQMLARANAGSRRGLLRHWLVQRRTGAPAERRCLTCDEALHTMARLSRLTDWHTHFALPDYRKARRRRDGRRLSSGRHAPGTLRRPEIPPRRIGQGRPFARTFQA